MDKPNALFAAAMMFVIIAAVITVNQLPGGELVLRDAYSGNEFARFPLEQGMVFSVTFIHSVNKSPYTDYYEASGEGFVVIGSRYYSYGAGVEAQPSQSLEMCDDGSIYVTEDRRQLPQLIYFIGRVSDYVLGINGEKYSLTLLCGENSTIEFIYD